ncbi:hypothetical protein EV421DRAFT_1788890 [Armillaria borealis]|uniref:Carboxylesterase type B domain-containing protein n=1 Tax=Armillaria borealis TaxID=47425 RepID=A0AA39MU21_9AGAR|nr:hypothetical protein EV421DRAFT_1788890 [Armillaria borealis]
MMVDYWVSFATSLDPNDGLGISRPFWPQYTPENEEQIDFIKDNAEVFSR